MSITLDLPDEITAALISQAKRAGQTLDAYVADAIRRRLTQGELQERQQLDDIDWALAIRRERNS